MKAKLAFSSCLLLFSLLFAAHIHTHMHTYVFVKAFYGITENGVTFQRADESYKTVKWTST